MPLIRKGHLNFLACFKPSLRTVKCASRVNSRHSLQIDDYLRDGDHLDVVTRSGFGAVCVCVFNFLPVHLEEQPATNLFQKDLQDIVEHFASHGVDGWESVFSPRLDLYRILI